MQIVVADSPPLTTSITLKLGSLVQIHIDDSGEGLVLRLVPIYSTDSVGRSHQIAVPYNSRLKLVIRSAFFQLADTLGVPLSRAQSTIVAFNTPADKDPDLFVLQSRVRNAERAR